jgi:hypothetical protein
MMDETFVRTTIQAQITRRRKTIAELEADHTAIALHSERIARLEHAICTLIEVQHVLRLCDCPDEAYITEEKP